MTALSNDSKLNEVAHRTLGALSRWAVPLMLCAIAALLKIGYDGFVAEFTTLRTELREAVTSINDTRKSDLAGIEARQAEQAAANRQVRDEQMARTTRIADLEATMRANTAWIHRADETMSKLREDVAAIRAILMKNSILPRGNEPGGHR